MVAFCILVLIFSYIPLVMQVFMAVVTAGSLYEFFSATGLRKRKILSTALNVILPFTVFVKIPYYEYILAVVLLTALVIFGCFMKNVKRLEGINDGLSVVISVIITILLNSIVYLRGMENGLLLLITAALVGVMTDTGAYAFGRLMGKHKLAPVISPKKTVEGAIGGTVTGVVVVILLCVCVNLSGILSMRILPVAAYALVGSVISQYGDLSMSSVKRIAKIKDYGNLFPGHGGFLDRFDSLMFVIPYTYLFLTFFCTFFNV